MTKDRINEYTLKITQASRTEIIVVLYELVDEYLDDAIASYNANKHDDFRDNCLKSGRVVRDLIGALDFTYDLSVALFRIYEYVSKEISMAVIKNKIEGLIECRKLMNSLKESFEKIAANDNSGPAMGNTQTVYAGLTYGKGVLNESIASESNRGYKA